MISDFIIEKQKGCNLIIKDTSHGYLFEVESRINKELNKFKYSETATMFIVEYLGETDQTVVAKKVFQHIDCESDLITIQPLEVSIEKDGYYSVTQLILPTVKCYEENKDDRNYPWKLCTSGVFLIDSKGRVVQATDDTYIEIDPLALPVDLCNSTVSGCTKDTFIICHLWDCYIKACKELLNARITECFDNSLKEATFRRDYLWMTLNVVKYYTEFEQYMEAQRLLTKVMGCNGMCSDKSNKNKSSCGCHKA